MRQSIALRSVDNARELGGYPAADGRVVRGGVLLRTASLTKLSPEDALRLERGLRVSTVVDLRTQDEQRLEPDPALRGAQTHSLSLMELRELPGVTDESLRLYLDAWKQGTVSELVKLALEYELINEDFYVNLVRAPRCSVGLRRFFRLLLEQEPDRALLWHCTDGKDRTGVAAMLLLTALGAQRSTILEDYLLTNAYNARRLAAARAAFGARPMDAHRSRMLTFLSGGVDALFLTNAMDALEADYGSVAGYLDAELGVGAVECRALREKYLCSC